jgi:Fic family protein
MDAAKIAARKAARDAAKTRIRPAGSLAGDGMTPMVPAEGKPKLEERAFELTREASAFAGNIPVENQLMMGEMVRSMNCYYSNLIEGHHTHPRDIDTALAKDYSRKPEKRNLQLEAAAHIHLQGLIDEGRDLRVAPASGEYARWLHREFCLHLPPELLTVENPETGECKTVVPGEFRDGGVAVGRHIPPRAEELSDYLKRFEDAYNPEKLPGIRYVVALGAAHHRFAWIHPFYDGNGRVVRLMSHAMLLRCGLGRMWSLARGLARSVDRYKELLAAADDLSERALAEFCVYFLETAIDQVKFMSGLLDTARLMDRIEAWTRGEVAAKRLEKGSFSILREAWYRGSVERGRVPEIANVKERQGREIVSRLVELRVLKSESPRGPLRLHAPIDVVEAWFPGLYPPFATMPETGARVYPGMM